MAAPVKQLSDGNPGGSGLGQSATDLISFYNVTPIAQRTAAVLTATASLFAITGASYVAQTSATVSGLFGFNSVVVVQLWDSIVEIRNFLATIGLHKGGA